MKGLCLQYPSKYKPLLTFLSSSLRDDGCERLKLDIVEAIVGIISQVLHLASGLDQTGLHDGTVLDPTKLRGINQHGS